MAANTDLIQRLSSWLSAPNPSSNLIAAQTKRHKDTGVWLLNHPTFLSWKSADHSLLWLHGKPGSGKTILSSTVIRSLLDASGSDTIVAYFYFDFQTHEKQLFQNFLNSIVVQLLSMSGRVSTIVEGLYNACDRGLSRPVVQDTLVALRRIIDEIGLSVHVVVDALDECRDRRSILQGLKDIRSWSQRNLHMFVTSRRETEIEDVFCPLATATIFLEESVVDKDIGTYIRYQLEHEDRLSKWSEEIREEIETVLVNGANGMFKWVECQLDAVRGCMKLGLLRKALRTLPKTLDETYASILGRIPEEHIEDARRILSCLTCAFCPLAIEEIAETLAVVNEGETYYDIENRLQEPRDILTICSALVEITNIHRDIRLFGSPTELKVLRLSHFSIKEYLSSDHIAAARLSRFGLDERYTHELLAVLCIRYLLWCGQERLCQDPQEWLQFGQIPHKSAFALYAASFWSSHLEAAQLHYSAPLYNDCVKMLRCPALLRDIIRLGAGFADEDAQTRDFRKYLYNNITLKFEASTIDVEIGDIPPLFYVSMLGLDELMLKLLAAGEDVNSVGFRLTPLAAAAFFGHTRFVQLLLDKDAEVNAVVPHLESGTRRYYSPTAVQCAAETGHEDIVKLLLANGADVNLCRAQPPTRGFGRVQDFNTPLEAAVMKSGAVQTRIVRILLDAGADVHACGHGGSAELLYLPIYRGDTDLVNLLLDAGADPNDNDGAETPLTWAIQRCQQQCIKLLLERGADLESIDSCLISKLYDLRDTYQFQPAIQIALELKPNLNTQTLLFAAAKYGQIKSVNLMLRNGTAPDILDETGVAALHAAAFTPDDDTQILELLLDAKANVNIHGGLFGSALQAAAMSGKAKAVSILLEHGATSDYTGGSYGTALQIAKKRLEDVERRAYSRAWLIGDGHQEYGPEGYYGPTRSPEHTRRRRKPADRVGDEYVPHFDFSYLPNADYRAVIEALQSHGAF